MACEDYPCCGHEAGDCGGPRDGSDEDIIAEVNNAWPTGHEYCGHENGVCNAGW